MRHYARRVKAIGGYLELQLPSGKEYYPDLIKLNTARNALEYIVKVNQYSLVYVPYYTCEVILEPLKKLGVTFHFYTIDKNLDPIIDFKIAPTECLLYTNYFGIKQTTVNRLSRSIKNLIIDNSQAFFAKPIRGIDTFYSCRKFFGVSDGAYLQTNILLSTKFERDVSVWRVSHLLKSIDLSVEEGYQDYLESRASLSNGAIKRMSKLTERVLKGIDYEECKSIRIRNFKIIHEGLGRYNTLFINLENIDGPMVYPFLINKKIRKKLIDKRIYIATYWPNVLKWTSERMFENYLTEHLVGIPIDHRYNEEDMERILNIVKQMI
ncbi:hypothetical protein Pedsa_0833 [Pseudopedobacter saltans DSM 12145]|uniref:DegT/DnrJ/EryC1/StrS aminotransferase n=1 Tax=Pseudopedobacter saltans (strain ATCC 51119 / DSM 12145 / JCM 21818 / CCUG 39354 / LMG 10337 / NBRC 100064 / NCIMB 13643) TaxID=762903 RepID=F0S9P9_PSESL|nr:hypothetical protein [Pseudopedobacter saltans]ADY51405.1 hypothetical protein Pedsa_0833 [Pseudopedobacter saltans DSM 12145]